MRESQLGRALHESTPQPTLTDGQRLEQVRDQLHSRSPWRGWPVVAAAAVIVIAALVFPMVMFGGLTLEPDPREPRDRNPNEPSLSLPPGTLTCRTMSTDHSGELGQITTGALGVRLCVTEPSGVRPDGTINGEVASLVELVNSLPAADNDHSFCGDGGEVFYDLVFGYADGHAEVVTGQTGGGCDLILVNEQDKSGATPVLAEFRRLANQSQ